MHLPISLTLSFRGVGYCVPVITLQSPDMFVSDLQSGSPFIILYSRILDSNLEECFSCVCYLKALQWAYNLAVYDTHMHLCLHLRKR